MSKRVLVFPDSNILFSSAYLPASRFNLLWEIPDVDILVCRYTLDEVTRNLKTPAQRARLWELINKSHRVPNATRTELPLGVSLVAKDAPVLLTAISAGANILVTGDKRHFEHLFGKTIAGVQIESFLQFINRYPAVFRPAEQDGR